MVDFESELWVWEARPDETWTFVSLPEDISEEIRDVAAGIPRGFGSVRVQARIGLSTWKTSIFPDSKRKAYVLPVKRAVRKAQGLQPGDTATVSVELIDL
jgi:hypothetical protein